MREQCNFSNVTKNYLSEFYCILDQMIEGMTTAELSCSISHNFIVQMIPHHRAAIEMSHNILCYTTNIPLQNIASNIITMQTQSIEDMRNVECICSSFTNSRQDICLYQRHFHSITETMFTEMGNACATNNINANFMREMIPHHKGAIRMSENALRYEICPELIPILEAIITSQKKGVQEMTQLLRCMN
ncbi:DUF305 domain-containing protein [Anaerosporobacter sp.]